MGASASLVEEKSEALPDNIRILLDVCERQKTKIYETESDLVEREMAKLFKGHNLIIDRLTGHSKPQLQRLFLFHASTVRHLDELVEAGNHYAKFIKQLVKSKEDLEWEAITSSSKPDYDEELLAEILGCSTTEEIKNLDKIFSREKAFCLADLFAAQTKPDSQLRHFAERILRFDRDESKTVDKNMAIKQASIIHKAGAARLIGVDEEPILDILATASRAQCAAINEAYIDAYKMKLERAINMKFKGNTGKLLVLWTQPLPSAIVTCAHYLCQKMLVDKSAVINFIAKYEKDMLASADEAAKSQHKKSLAELMGQGVSGTLHRAIKGWIELPSPDKGFERILDLYIKSRQDKGLTLEEMLRDDELKAKLHFLIEKQAQEMKLYMIDHKIKLDAGDQALLAKSFTTNVKRAPAAASDSSISLQVNDKMATQNSARSIGSNGSSSNLHHPAMRTVEIDDEETGVTTPRSPALRAIPELRQLENKLKPADGSLVENEKKAKKVYQYLVEACERVDVQAEGALSARQFWSLLYDLPLRELGFTQGELDLMRQYSSWETDGQVYYYEVLFELGDSVIAAIESKTEGDRDVLSVIDGLKEKEKTVDTHHVKTTAVVTSNKFLSSSDPNPGGRLGLAEASCRKGSVYQYPNIPIYFRQYLVDTLLAFDLDCNGFLTDKELATLLEVVNVPDLTLAHLLGEGVASITPKAASDAILAVVDPYFTDGVEHYVCLVDRGSGAYFWYNTLDGSTQWADNSYAADQPAPSVPAPDVGDEESADEADPFGPDDVLEQEARSRKKSQKSFRAAAAAAAAEAEDADADAPADPAESKEGPGDLLGGETKAVGVHDDESKDVGVHDDEAKDVGVHGDEAKDVGVHDDEAKDSPAPVPASEAAAGEEEAAGARLEGSARQRSSTSDLAAVSTKAAAPPLKTSQSSSALPADEPAAE